MKNLALFLVAVPLFACASQAKANDFGVHGVGGSWKPYRAEHSTVRMIREKVRVDIFDERYDVVVDFSFRNEGAATKVDMAFPENASGADVLSKEDLSSGFQSFQTSVNGKVVPVKRVITSTRTQDGVDYQALWIKRVTFGRGESKAVQVRYSSQPGSAAGVGRFAAYSFTGSNWKDSVGQSSLTVTLHSSLSQSIRAFFRQRPLKMTKTGGSYSYTWRNWQADGYFSFWYDMVEGQEGNIEADLR